MDQCHSEILSSLEESKSEQKTISVAIYARTSSPNQRFNYSIREQVDQCKNYCKQRGWAITHIFVDEGESGGTVERAKFQLMLQKANSGDFDVIVFWKLDRFCRSLVDLINVERALRKCGVGLCSVTEYIDTTTSVGRFNFRSIASVAELERELIGERARMGLHALAKEHRWPNPHPPLGYDRENSGRLLVNKEEADLVLKILKMYLEEKSMPQVAFDLNEEGIPTKPGKKWNARAIRDILTNEIYIGKYRVAGVNHYVEEYRVVSDDLFQQVQGIRLRYKIGKARRPPMPETRKNAKIDGIFNQFLRSLSQTEEVQIGASNCKTKTLRGEKELFRLLNEGWNLIKVVGDEFIVGKHDP